MTDTSETKPTETPAPKRKMGSPIIRVQGRNLREEIAEDRARFLAYMAPVIVKAVEESYLDPETGKMRAYTHQELKERVDWATATINTLRYDFRLSKFHIRDVLPQLLRARLKGEKVDLQAVLRRQSWWGK